MEINKPFPDFVQNSTKGKLRFYEFKKKRWCLFSSFRKSCTPVNTTELVELSLFSSRLKEQGVLMLGFSCDSIDMIHTWLGDIKEHFNREIHFPIISDEKRRISNTLLLTNSKDSEHPANCSVLIDPENMIRSISFSPNTVGRSVEEQMRLLEGLTLSLKHPISTPSDWVPGQDVYVDPEREFDCDLPLIHFNHYLKRIQMPKDT